MFVCLFVCLCALLGGLCKAYTQVSSVGVINSKLTSQDMQCDVSLSFSCSFVCLSACFVCGSTGSCLPFWLFSRHSHCHAYHAVNPRDVVTDLVFVRFELPRYQLVWMWWRLKQWHQTRMSFRLWLKLKMTKMHLWLFETCPSVDSHVIL